MPPDSAAPGPVQQQRFCPFCDRAFVDGEAVLRCDGCGVLHHPACWVKNDGCVTQTPHESHPLAQAYGVVRPAAAQAPHPAEGTRRLRPPAQGDGGGAATAPPPIPLPARSQPQAEARRISPEPAAEGPLIGGDFGAQPMLRHVNPPPEPAPRPAAPRRYEPPADGAPGHAPLPKVYGRHPILNYWYVPAAAAVAVGVALAVVWVAGRFTGGDEPVATVTTPTVAAAATSPAAVATTAVTPAGGAASPAASPVAPTPTAVPAGTTGPGKFKAGETLVVTGAGDCLNVRTNPGRQNDAIVCLPDGSEVVVRGGPERNGDITWWKVQTKLGEGWAAEDYLVHKP